MFSLIGPKRYDAPWKDIESQGWIAPADCVEVRVSLPTDERLAYATSEPEERYRIASCTHQKLQVVRDLVAAHADQPTLVIGQYIDQLDELAAALDAPLIKGETTVKERQRLFQAFRTGEVGLLVVSQGRQLLDRPALGRGRHPGLRRLRLPPGGGPAPRPAAAPQDRGQDRALLHDRLPRHRRRRLRPEPAAVPRRAGLRLPDRGRRGPARPDPPHSRNQPAQRISPSLGSRVAGRPTGDLQQGKDDGADHTEAHELGFHPR